MDSAAILAKRKAAPSVIAHYEKKLRELQAQIVLLETETHSKEAKAMLGYWVSNNEEWLTKNQKDYEAAKAVVQIPIELLQEIDEAFARVYNS